MKKPIAELIKQVIEENYGEKLEIAVEIPKVKKFGDFSTNAAILLSPKINKPLLALAEDLAKKISEKDNGKYFGKIEAYKNGFINFTFDQKFLLSKVSEIIKLGDDYGKSNLGKGKRVLIEFVSANPTGPLHIGHGRWAVIGDDIASLLSAVGYTVEREFYVNNVGNQIEKLEASVRARAAGQEIPDKGYGGAYVSEVAEQLKNELSNPHFRQVLINYLLDGQKRVLRELSVDFDAYFFESTVHETGKVKEAINRLKENGKTFEEGGALWFKSEEDGDDKNRVLVRENGETTYFAADIAYHLDKYLRGYDCLIDVWGSDHHGYVPRLKAAIRALGLNSDKLEIIIGQLVALYRGKEPVKMSKRTGDMITLEEVVSEIGKDATRFFLTMVKSSSHLEFDLNLAKEQAPSNPVYYVQYAHARIMSIFREAEEQGFILQEKVNYSLLVHDSERELIKKLLALSDELISAAQRREPHLVVEYARSLAALFHNFYHQCRVITDDKELSLARLSLLMATRITLKNVLKLLKVDAPERM